MSVISNTTVISNFASIGQLELLRRLYETLYISTQVHKEIQTGLEEGYKFYTGIDQLIHPFVAQGWIRLTSMSDEEELRTFGMLPSHLHQGEASCLAIAHNRGWTLLTDDQAARKQAISLGIRLSGTLGCLILAIERDLCALERANHWLSEMIRFGYRSPVAELTTLLKH